MYPTESIKYVQSSWTFKSRYTTISNSNTFSIELILIVTVFVYENIAMEKSYKIDGHCDHNARVNRKSYYLI